MAVPAWKWQECREWCSAPLSAFVLARPASETTPWSFSDELDNLFADVADAEALRGATALYQRRLLR